MNQPSLVPAERESTLTSRASVRKRARPRDLFRRARELFPLTALGGWVGAFSAFALQYWAYGELDLVILVSSYGAMSLIGGSVVLVSLAALRLAWRLRASLQPFEARLETGRESTTGYSLPALRFVPWVKVRILWEGPKGRVSGERQGASLVERVSLPRRGVYSTIGRRVVVGDVFGLAQITLRQEQSATLRVAPSAGALRRVELMPSFSGGDEWPHPLGLADGDRVELRRYVPGDPARFIHWGVFARTRTLMVRVPERAVSRARRTAAYLITGTNDGASAAAARVAVESSSFGPDWVFGVDGISKVYRQSAEALGAIERSGTLASSEGAGLHEFLLKVEEQGPASIVVFAPPRRGAWCDEVMKIAARRPGQVRLVLGVDGLQRSTPRPLWSRLLLGAPEATSRGFEATERVVQEMARAGVEAHVVDRASGRRLGGHEMSARGKRSQAA
jgi:hypothetical protein